jgi:Tol biopolymer transport system component
VSVATDGTQGNNGLDADEEPSISSDGRLVAFGSDSTNMVAQNVNGWGDIYLRDTCAGAPAGCTPATSLVSLGNDGSISNQSERDQSMSADGRFVAFVSLASNLVPGDTFTPGDWSDIFVRDTCFGVATGCKPSTVRVSVATTPYDTESNDVNDYPRISADGHYVVFLSAATNYLPTGGNGHQMVYLAKTGF